MTPHGASISIRDLVAGYDRVRVLDGISLDIAPGTLVALLGSSGCGKTTLLRTISGFIRAQSGSIVVDGRDVAAVPPERRNMAMVFQSYALWPHMTVAQNIGYGLRLRRVPRGAIATKVEELLAFLGLAGLGARPVTSLSGGQRQRVALGRALAVDPRILLLDEPLSNLDAKIRLTMRHEIRAIQQKLGVTAVHVTHDQEEAMVMADRIVILDQGRIVQDGSPEEVYRRPNSPFVASFLGAENVISGELRQEGDALSLQLPSGTSAPLPPRLDPQAVAGPCRIHFRGNAARLGTGEDGLSLPGEILQASYPGGRYRYSVATPAGTYLVDDERRASVGDRVQVTIPADALHIFAAAEAAHLPPTSG
jgi:ABC-type Fe3+/spermidine/putrescine transport system ATPase subunit